MDPAQAVREPPCHRYLLEISLLIGTQHQDRLHMAGKRYFLLRSQLVRVDTRLALDRKGALLVEGGEGIRGPGPAAKDVARGKPACCVGLTGTSDLSWGPPPPLQ